MTGMGNFTAEQIAENARKKYGKCLCVECSQKAKAEADAKAAEEAKPAEPQDDLAAELLEEAEK